jgi:hypothetical protein
VESVSPLSFEERLLFILGYVVIGEKASVLLDFEFIPWRRRSPSQHDFLGLRSHEFTKKRS